MKTTVFAFCLAALAVSVHVYAYEDQGQLRDYAELHRRDRKVVVPLRHYRFVLRAASRDARD